MKKVIRLFGKKFNISIFNNIAKAISNFSFAEKIIFGIFSVVFVLSTLLILSKVNEQFLVKIPKVGGTLYEGVVGTPRFINPLLAISETDRDLTTLIYSGLTRITPEGDVIPDIAYSYEVTEDGLEYIFKIRDDAVFHDGKPVTADDVVFTIEKAKDSVIKSPKRANWEGVTVEKLSENEIRFVLSQPYSPFLFNTTLGILPKHIWDNVSSEEFAFTQVNIEPVGSGPYKLSKIRRNSAGIAEKYELKSFDKFTLGKPYIKYIHYSFFKNEELLLSAFRGNQINSINSIQPSNAKKLEEEGYVVKEFSLPRIFGVFLNQSKAPILASKKVRLALDKAINKETVVENVLYGYGTVANGPIPESIIPFTQLDNSEENKKEETTSNIDEAKIILEEAGFKLNDKGIMEHKTKEGTELLSFSVSTANVPELVAAAEQVIESWKQIGADVTLKVFDPNDFNQNVIRPRNYDSILFGEIIGPDLDFFAFWHSSQRNDPGLNIADYANINIDSVLEDSRQLGDSPERIEKFRIFVNEIKNDVPAIFLYSPNFIYVVPEKLQGVVPKNIATPSERFLSVYNWYLETDTVWRIFN
ncbi:MAG: peptide ABC transporter substrate-binding protein [Candidatus Pacebacteria bacterium]|nr:peptide ABC transporter substrate-binding protein [Candidatus Paceibacterota bacterium]